MITIEEVAECLALPIALYPSFPFGRPQIVAYYEMLKDADVTKQELLEAIKGAVKDSTYFPTVAGIYIYINRKPTPQPPQFNALEFTKQEAIPMPSGLKALISKSFNLPTEGENHEGTM